MAVQCKNPNCQSENAYHDGVRYVCPDCGYEWDDDIEWDDDSDEED